MRVARSFAFALAAALAVYFFAACTEDVHNEVYTTDNSRQVQSDVVNSTVLTDDEKRSFQQEVARDDYQPYGKTVATILADAQREEAADQKAAAAAATASAAAEAAARERTRALNNDLKIYPDGITVVPGGADFGTSHVDEPFKDKDTFTFVVQNGGSKSISAFSANATLTNEGGEVLYSGTLNDSTELAPGGKDKLVIKTTPTDFNALPNPELVRRASINDAVVHYTVQRIDYSDGSSITRSQ